MLGEFAATLTAFLNTLDTSKWGTLKVPDYVQATTVIDPEQLTSATTRKLCVMPLVTSFPREGMEGRRQVTSFEAQLQVSVALLIPFETFNRDDVAPWSRVAEVLELREKIDFNIIRNDWTPYKLIDVDPQPPVEIELNQRNFLSVTDFTFSGRTC